MHPSLEKRLRGGLLAVGIGVGSLYLSGCATNNPALNAFMNYGVAPILAADAGRSQQTVIVNGGQPQENIAGVIQRSILQGWRFVACEKWVDYDGNGRVSENELVGVGNRFNVTQKICLVGGNISPYFKTRELAYALFDEQQARIQSHSFAQDNSTGAMIKSDNTPGGLKPGKYTAVWFYRNEIKGKVAFEVVDSLTLAK